MEPVTAFLAALVPALAHELMLFAAIGILVFGLDDTLVDAVWLANRRALAPQPLAPPLAGPVAVFIPAWHEAAVLPPMLAHLQSVWAGEDVRVYIGVYANDPDTLFAVSRVVAADPRLRLVINPAAGPTTKADNLNAMWTALRRDEAAGAIPCSAVLLHDAEDRVHLAGLVVIRRYLAGRAMVQLPVQPLLLPHSPWIAGHYADEFAESHGKQMPLRAWLAAGLPAAGVGCAFSRQALTALARARGGLPFAADSLTEDYEAGLLLAAMDLPSCFVDVCDSSGSRVATHSAFPDAIGPAVRQKSRWIAGIALAGWDRLGWLDRGGNPAKHWLLWQDRRAPLAALVILAAYAAAGVSLVAAAGAAAGMWATQPWSPVIQAVMAANLGLLVWRLGMRAWFTGRVYGWRQGLVAVPRVVVANTLAVMAARRAVAVYWRMAMGAPTRWDKTAHIFPAPVTSPPPVAALPSPPPVAALPSTPPMAAVPPANGTARRRGR